MPVGLDHRLDGPGAGEGVPTVHGLPTALVEDPCRWLRGAAVRCRLPSDGDHRPAGTEEIRHLLVTGAFQLTGHPFPGLASVGGAPHPPVAILTVPVRPGEQQLLGATGQGRDVRRDHAELGVDFGEVPFGPRAVLLLPQDRPVADVPDRQEPTASQVHGIDHVRARFLLIEGHRPLRPGSSVGRGEHDGAGPRVVDLAAEGDGTVRTEGDRGEGGLTGRTRGRPLQIDSVPRMTVVRPPQLRQAVEHPRRHEAPAEGGDVVQFARRLAAQITTHLLPGARVPGGALRIPPPDPGSVVTASDGHRRAAALGDRTHPVVARPRERLRGHPLPEAQGSALAGGRRLGGARLRVAGDRGVGSDLDPVHLQLGQHERDDQDHHGGGTRPGDRRHHPAGTSTGPPDPVEDRVGVDLLGLIADGRRGPSCALVEGHRSPPSSMSSSSRSASRRRPRCRWTFAVLSAQPMIRAISATGRSSR